MVRVRHPSTQRAATALKYLVSSKSQDILVFIPTLSFHVRHVGISESHSVEFHTEQLSPSKLGTVAVASVANMD